MMKQQLAGLLYNLHLDAKKNSLRVVNNKKLSFLFSLLLFSASYSQVGVNTDSPTSTVDINGNLRVRNIPESTSTSDISLVSDADGNVKQQLNSKKGIMKGYLNANFSSGNVNTDIYKILNWNEIDDPNNDFNPGTGIFVAPTTGLYRINITASLSSRNTIPLSYVIGLVDNSDKWIMRFSIPDNYIEGTAPEVGAASSFTGVVELTAGQSYYYGVSYYITIVSRPSGSTGTGLGTYFDIELIKKL